MKKKFRVVKNFKIVKRSCSLDKYYGVGELKLMNKYDAVLKETFRLQFNFKLIEQIRILLSTNISLLLRLLM